MATLYTVEESQKMVASQPKSQLQAALLTIDNRWIVPYCSLLSKMFIAHINIEYCNSVKAIKYICKYVNKGNEQAVFRLEQQGITQMKWQGTRLADTSVAMKQHVKS